MNVAFLLISFGGEETGRKEEEEEEEEGKKRRSSECVRACLRRTAEMDNLNEGMDE